jgi:hypothetical protein
VLDRRRCGWGTTELAELAELAALAAVLPTTGEEARLTTRALD